MVEVFDDLEEVILVGGKVWGVACGVGNAECSGGEGLGFFYFDLCGEGPDGGWVGYVGWVGGLAGVRKTKLREGVSSVFTHSTRRVSSIVGWLRWGSRKAGV